MRTLAYAFFTICFVLLAGFEIVNGNDAAGLIAMACAILLQIDLHIQDRQTPK